MDCLQCGRTNPEDARYCIYCSAQLVPAEETAPTRPATGPTTRLEQPQPMPSTPPVAPGSDSPSAPAAAPAASTTCGWGIGREKEVSTAVWLIGLGVLFLTGNFWPGILVLVGLSAYMHETAKGDQQGALRSLLFFAGLAALFWTNLFWPGILILIGLAMLVSPKLRRSSP